MFIITEGLDIYSRATLGGLAQLARSLSLLVPPCCVRLEPPTIPAPAGTCEDRRMCARLNLVCLGIEVPER